MLIEYFNLDGKIALIQRGSFSFAEKAKNAYANGAIGVVIYNNVDGMTNGTLGSFKDSVVSSVGMSKEDRDVLVDKLKNGETIEASILPKIQ
ncbi:MAG: PA domain-containing protein [Paraclostridium sp.]